MKCRLVVLLAIAFLASAAATSIPATYLQSLPAGATVSGIALDPAGNLVVAGTIQTPGKDYHSNDAFAAKFSPDGQTRLYLALLAGSDSDVAGPVVTDASGNAYVSGGTSSADFPTSANAYETTPNGATSAGFVVKLDPTGKIVFSTLFGGGNQQNTGISGMAVSPSGEIFLTGQTVGGNFATTPSPIKPDNSFNTFYVARLSAAGDRLVYAVTGIGGRAVTADEQNSIYILGFSFNTLNGEDVPVTPNAFQTTVHPTVCSGNRAFVFPCDHQYVAKMDATGMKLIFCTFLSGSDSDSPAQIAIDGNHDIYVAGTTGSVDYPTTAGAIQTQNHVYVAPQPPGWNFFTDGDYAAFPNTAYVTKLAGDGTHLIYSTLLGGSEVDGATGIAVDAAGQAYVALSLQSPDFPGLPAVPQRCRPDHGRYMPALARLDAAGDAVNLFSLVEGAASVGGPLLAVGAGTAFLAGASGYLAQAAPGSNGPPDAVACITDNTDYAQSGPLAPGELLTIFGTNIGPASPAAADLSQPLPTSLAGASVLVNGIAAPLLYASQNQINFQTPAVVAGQGYATVQVAGAQRVLPIAPSNPSLFTGGNLGYPTCDGQVVNAVQAMVVNADGSLNSCDNPAAPGAVVSVFVNGAGAAQPQFSSNIAGGVSMVSFSPVAAGIPDVWQVNLRPTGGTAVSNTSSEFVSGSVQVNGVSVRESGFAIWVSKAN